MHAPARRPGVQNVSGWRGPWRAWRPPGASVCRRGDRCTRLRAGPGRGSAGMPRAFCRRAWASWPARLYSPRRAVNIANELGTRDVVDQITARLGDLEEGQRLLRSELSGRLDQVQAQLSGDRRWLVGLVLGSWMTIMLSIFGLCIRI